MNTTRANGCRPLLGLLLSTGAIWATCSTAVLAQSPNAPDASSSPSAQATGQQQQAASQDIVVTARKVGERLQDVPAAVSVVNTTSLVTSNISRLRDYFEMVPGLQLSPYPGGAAAQTVSIRGISSGVGTNPTVASLVDDVPFGSSNMDFTPDIDPSDLQRIEVLRGPQGTLYGASSMGGLIKYVTTDPSTTDLSGHVEAGLSGVSHGSSVGYDFRGGLNVPLSSTLAVRVSGYTRYEPGYIDDPSINRKDVNGITSSGGHASLLWQATNDVSVKLSALYQHTHGDGSGEGIQAPGEDPYQNAYILNTGQFTKNLQSYSGVIHAKVAGIDLTSVTGYSRLELSASRTIPQQRRLGPMLSCCSGSPVPRTRLIPTSRG